MTTSETQGDTARPTVPSTVAWQSARVAVGLISAGIGVYQFVSGHDMGGAFSFLMAAMFLVRVSCDRAVLRPRREGAALGVQLAMRAL